MIVEFPTVDVENEDVQIQRLVNTRHIIRAEALGHGTFLYMEGNTNIWVDLPYSEVAEKLLATN